MLMEVCKKWDTKRESWLCKNHSRWDGSMLRFDIHHIDQYFKKKKWVFDTENYEKNI